MGKKRIPQDISDNAEPHCENVDRRRAIGKLAALGGMASYTAPTMQALLFSETAVAQSGSAQSFGADGQSAYFEPAGDLSDAVGGLDAGLENVDLETPLYSKDYEQ